MATHDALPILASYIVHSIVYADLQHKLFKCTIIAVTVPFKINWVILVTLPMKSCNNKSCDFRNLEEERPH